MPATANVSPTGNAYVDAVIGGVKWAVSSLTFSFPADSAFYGSGYGFGEPGSHFQGFNSAQQIGVRAILQTYSSMANVTFAEIAETSTQHADLRFAESDAPGTAWTYYPSTSASGGDGWFNSSSGAYDNPQKGNYAWLTMLHEIGHGMGLKHPHETSGAFGQMPVGRDSLEYSVMSYHSYSGATQPYYTNESWSYPQSLMMYDIAALQALYGANYATNAGDTVYRWNSNTGEMSVNGIGQGAPGGNRVFLTIWDGGGNDTYDFSNYSGNLNVSLQPGSWSTVSAVQLANLGDGHLATGNIANALLYQNNPASLIENVIGGSGNDSIVGNAANNTLTGGPGNDSIDGIAGDDTARFSGRYSDYSVTQNADGNWTVVDLRAGSPDGTDNLSHIKYLQFQDVTFSGQLAQSAPPNSRDDYYAAAARKQFVVQGAGVLTNDVDADGSALAATLVSGPKNGKLTLKQDGSFIYTPSKYFVGIDSFTYKATDGSGSDVATVWIKVGASKGTIAPTTNAVPVATGDAYTMTAGSKLKITSGASILKNDTDGDGNKLSAVLVSKPHHGSLSIKADGTFSYIPSRKFVGTDSFTYKASDGWSLSDTVTVTITVGPKAGQIAKGNIDHDQLPSHSNVHLVSDWSGGTFAERLQDLVGSHDWRTFDSSHDNHNPSLDVHNPHHDAFDAVWLLR